MNAGDLAGYLVRNLRHKEEMMQIPVSQPFDGRDTLCKQFSSQAAQFRQVEWMLRPIGLSQKHAPLIKGLRNNIPLRPIPVPEAAGRFPVAVFTKGWMIHGT